MGGLKKRAAGDAGFALAWVVVAAAALGVAAFLLGGLLVRSLHDQRASEDAFLAVLLAQEKAEEIKSLPFDQVAPEPEAEVPGCPGFRRSVAVDQVDPCTKRVAVRVSYAVPGIGRTGAQELVFERTVDF
jgi:Tfp pilus assembly protein PilV